MKVVAVIFALICAVTARPEGEIIFEDSDNSAPDQVQPRSGLSTLPPFPTLKISEEDPVPTTYRPLPSFKGNLPRFHPAELNSLAYDDGYVYEKPDIPFEDKTFEGYTYDRPKNPMTLPSVVPSPSSTTTPTEEGPLDIDLPEIAIRGAFD